MDTVSSSHITPKPLHHCHQQRPSPPPPPNQQPPPPSPPHSLLFHPTLHPIEPSPFPNAASSQPRRGTPARAPTDIPEAPATLKPHCRSLPCSQQPSFCPMRSCHSWFHEHVPTPNQHSSPPSIFSVYELCAFPATSKCKPYASASTLNLYAIRDDDGFHPKFNAYVARRLFWAESGLKEALF
ncbi:hypothetical protein M758_10G046300 [Ceratodon purpureus]|uniref:Uncharacterized protein n=1 Tax=Ceratodon purpureus TaxID=3225 RepID=A0A8T0GKG0_CERPU|nr:hypothetical protein KC19_10G048900 [Ceratodon purpureus]KAG0602847.1 hypothetical protein M758_10G046300 [Ceratodon purpureus]